MKTYLIGLSLFIHLSAGCQRHELDLNFRGGIHVGNMRTGETPPRGLFESTTKAFDLDKRQDSQIASLYDKGIVLNYKYNFWEKYNWYFSSGIELAQARHVMRIPMLFGDGLHIANVNVTKTRVVWHPIGLHKQFLLFDDKLIIDLGADWIYKDYLTNEDRYSTTTPLSSDQISYKSDKYSYKYWYNLSTYYGQSRENTLQKDKDLFILDYNLHAKLKIRDQTYFNFGINYVRNNLFYYEITYTVYFFSDGVPSGSQSLFPIVGLFDPKRAFNDNYLYFNFGLTQKF